MEKDRMKKIIRDKYGAIAENKGSCCGPSASCCGSSRKADDIGRTIGYSEDELNSLPGEANLGLGCGNPTAIDSLSDGEAVLDLGSGAGIDCFIAARKVGTTGKVVGVDMTPEMLDRARQYAKEGGYDNVEFRLGEIENLPAGDGSFDVVISNCVINLSPDKTKVFEEAFRVLKPGGRLLVSDIVLLEELPSSVRQSVEAYTGCIAGALLRDDYLERMKRAGFTNVDVLKEVLLSLDELLPGEIDDHRASVESITIRAVKPLRNNLTGQAHM